MSRVLSDDTASAEKQDVQVPIRQVIGAYYSETSLEVYFLYKKKRKSDFSLTKVEGKVKDTDTAKKWSEALMDAAYQGTSSTTFCCIKSGVNIDRAI